MSRVYNGMDETTGRKRWRFVGTYPNKKTAEDAERDAEYETAHGLALDPTRAKLSEFLDSWIEAQPDLIRAVRKDDIKRVAEAIIKLTQAGRGVVRGEAAPPPPSKN